MRKLFVAVLAFAFLCPIAVQAQEPAKFGPFSALKMDNQVVQGVAVDGDNVYVKVAKDFWNASFTVRISNKNGADYRKWSGDKTEMVVKVYQTDKVNKQGYTYKINSSAKFIEYHMDGKLVLQLERTK
jgi:hypothetical protein